MDYITNCAVQDNTNMASESCQLIGIFFHKCVIHQWNDMPRTDSDKSCMNLSVRCPSCLSFLTRHLSQTVGVIFHYYDTVQGKQCWQVALQKIFQHSHNYLVKRTKTKIMFEAWRGCNIHIFLLFCTLTYIKYTKKLSFLGMVKRSTLFKTTVVHSYLGFAEFGEDGDNYGL